MNRLNGYRTHTRTYIRKDPQLCVNLIVCLSVSVRTQYSIVNGKKEMNSRRYLCLRQKNTYNALATHNTSERNQWILCDARRSIHRINWILVNEPGQKRHAHNQTNLHAAYAFDSLIMNNFTF